jgi:hypothetical protein
VFLSRQSLNASTEVGQQSWKLMLNTREKWTTSERRIIICELPYAQGMEAIWPLYAQGAEAMEQVTLFSLSPIPTIQAHSLPKIVDFDQKQ